MPGQALAQDKAPADGLIPAAALLRGLIRLFQDLGLEGIPEVTLPNGRRADLLAINAKGEITIVEIKSCLNDFRTDRKWPDYKPFCDRFLFCVSNAFPADVLPVETGLVIADQFGGEIVRDPPDHPLPAARRKALTLRFARLAAARLNAAHMATPALSPMDAGSIVP